VRISYEQLTHQTQKNIEKARAGEMKKACLQHITAIKKGQPTPFQKALQVMSAFM